MNNSNLPFGNPYPAAQHGIDLDDLTAEQTTNLLEGWNVGMDLLDKVADEVIDDDDGQPIAGLAGLPLCAWIDTNTLALFRIMEEFVIEQEPERAAEVKLFNVDPLHYILHRCVYLILGLLIREGKINVKV